MNLNATHNQKDRIMNEAETRAELIDPKLTACGWGVVEASKVFSEFAITADKIQAGGTRENP